MEAKEGEDMEDKEGGVCNNVKDVEKEGCAVQSQEPGDDELDREVCGSGEQRQRTDDEDMEGQLKKRSVCSLSADGHQSDENTVSGQGTGTNSSSQRVQGTLTFGNPLARLQKPLTSYEQRFEAAADAKQQENDNLVVGANAPTGAYGESRRGENHGPIPSFMEEVLKRSMDGGRISRTRN